MIRSNYFSNFMRFTGRNEKIKYRQSIPTYSREIPLQTREHCVECLSSCESILSSPVVLIFICLFFLKGCLNFIYRIWVWYTNKLFLHWKKKRKNWIWIFLDIEIWVSECMRLRHFMCIPSLLLIIIFFVFRTWPQPIRDSWNPPQPFKGFMKPSSSFFSSKKWQLQQNTLSESFCLYFCCFKRSFDDFIWKPFTRYFVIIKFWILFSFNGKFILRFDVLCNLRSILIQFNEIEWILPSFLGQFFK